MKKQKATNSSLQSENANLKKIADALKKDCENLLQKVDQLKSESPSEKLT